MQWVFVVAVGVVSLGVNGDDCVPFFKPGDKLPPAPFQCCKKEVKIPEVMKKNIPKCEAKYVLPKKIEFEDYAKPEVRDALSCSAECVFEESGLLTEDNTIDVAAFKKVLTATYPDQKNIPENVDKCFSSLPSMVDKDLDCKSGAFQMQNCMAHMCFLNCSKDKWNSTKDCDDLKKKVEKCPNYPMVWLTMVHRM